MLRLGVIGIGLSMAVVFCPVSTAATITVNLAGGGDYSEIQAAIDAADSTDTVLVKTGEYVITEPITFRGKAITVRGEEGAERTTIRMAEKPTDAARASVVIFENGEAEASVLEGFTLSGGQGTIFGACGPNEAAGGGVSSRENCSPTLLGCRITGNSAAQGGGVHCGDSSSPNLIGCTIAGNVLTLSAADARCRNVALRGAGVYFGARSSAILTRCTIRENSASSEGFGGGVYAGEDSSAVLNRCKIFANFAQDGAGGGVYVGRDSSLALNNSTVTENLARTGGGLHCFSSDPTLTNSIVWNNGGGSIGLERNSNPRVTFSCVESPTVWPGAGNINADPLFCGGWESEEVFARTQADFDAAITAGHATNVALSAASPCLGSGEGGVNIGADAGLCEQAGISTRLIRLARGTYQMTAAVLHHRVSLMGAAQKETIIEGTVSGLRTGAVLSNLTVTGGRRGGIRVGADESPEIVDCTITGNSALSGGGVYCAENSSPTLANCTVWGNLAEVAGGGVSCSENSSPTLSNCTISLNTAQNGSGLYCRDQSRPTLSDCTITGNAAEGVAGGMYCDDNSSGTMVNCRVVGNWAAFDGGGVYSVGGASPVFINCLLAGNACGATGGGVYAGPDSAAALTNCTVSGNAAERGGGFQSTSSVSLKNSIVWGNVGGAIAGNIGAQHSCIESGRVWPGEGNINSDPRFVASGIFLSGNFITVEITGNLRELPDFIFDIGDYTLRAGSPAIDAGTDGAPPTDIEGNARPCGGLVDMGAYESGNCDALSLFLRGDADSSGVLDISDAVYNLRFQFAGDVIPTCLDALDDNDDGEINLTDPIFSLSVQFLGGGPMPTPGHEECGSDPTEDLLTCDVHAFCGELGP